MKIFGLIVLAILIVSAPACNLRPTAPTPTFTITGKVYIQLEGDSGEVYLAGAEVRLLDTAGRELAKTVTSDTGEYTFKDLSNGEYAVTSRLALDNFIYEDNQEVILSQGDKTEVNLDLHLRKKGFKLTKAGNTGFFALMG